MIADENILAQIETLLLSGSIPRSASSRGLLKVLKPLLDAGVVVEKRSGAGRRLEVSNFAALRSFKDKHYPQITLPEGLSTRVAGVARFRESKSFRNDTPEIVTLRAWTEGALLKRGELTEAVRLTKEHGVFSFLADECSLYSLNGCCALVENPAVFTRFEKLGVPMDLAILVHGKISNRLLEWLSGMANLSCFHFPDYDPVGLTDFERLRKALGFRVHIYIPSDLAQRFARFSNQSLLKTENTRASLAKLGNAAQQLETRQILDLITRHNAVLEQEALLLPL